jgi:hypothetical protein
MPGRLGRSLRKSKPTLTFFDLICCLLEAPCALLAGASRGRLREAAGRWRKEGGGMFAAIAAAAAALSLQIQQQSQCLALHKTLCVLLYW